MTSSEATKIRYVAIGDSFTEGVGDELPGGAVRGWADRVAEGLAQAVGEPISYANLAIRGRLLGPIIDEQLEPALALGPTLVTFNGGGNDMLRPGTDLPQIIARTEAVLRRIRDSGAEPLLLAGANPTGGLPMGSRVARKGDELARAAAVLAEQLGIRYANNWADPELTGAQYWSMDRLHLNPIGHQRVAANVLAALGYSAPASWVTAAPAPGHAPSFVDNARFAREHVAPWVKRRFTGRSSGDGRLPKYATWTVIEPGPSTGHEQP